MLQQQKLFDVVLVFYMIYSFYISYCCSHVSLFVLYSAPRGFSQVLWLSHLLNLDNIKFCFDLTWFSLSWFVLCMVWKGMITMLVTYMDVLNKRISTNGTKVSLRKLWRWNISWRIRWLAWFSLLLLVQGNTTWKMIQQIVSKSQL